MTELIKEIGGYVYRFITHRVLWLGIITVVLFGLLLIQLFELQIILADTFMPQPPVTHEVTIPIQPLRGTIYDRHGRPLAINTLTTVVKMDPSVRISNEGLLTLSQLFERNGEDYIDSFPITLNPFEFTVNERQQFRWQDDMTIPNAGETCAEESFLYLRERAGIDPELSHEDARRILNFWCKIFRERLISVATFRPVPILFAVDISPETAAAIEEQNALFAGVYIDIQTQREYPAGIYMSHIIGYIWTITAEDLYENQHLGYTHLDLYGIRGLERSRESYLRGIPGQQLIEFDRSGRRVGEPVIIQEAQPGDRIFLTIDLDLQMKAYYMLKDYLTQTLVNRINLRDSRERAVTLEEVFISFVQGHNLDVRAILAAEEGPAMWMQNYITSRIQDPDPANREDAAQIIRIVTDGIRSRRISPAQMLLTLIGTGQISDPDGEIEQRLTTRPQAARDVLIDKIEAWEITPSQVNLDPSTASMVIVDVPTGAVLAAVSYPSYDNNRLVNNRDWIYWDHVYNLDPTNPGIERAFREPRAPGSNFKMITAVAALETGAIYPHTRITDRVAFTRAGRPHFHCWSSRGHGSINVTGAIAGSCNYFFAESSWRMGQGAPDAAAATLQRIERLNTYMKHFGLHERSGVEILELLDQNSGFDGLRIASPEFKRHRELVTNPNAAEHDIRWNNGDTVRTSIGQGLNDYTTAQMARAMNVFANRGVNYPLHLIGHIENNTGEVVFVTIPEPVCIGLEFNESTWDSVTEGMRLVTERGAAGTAVGLFQDQGFPIRVAGKTSTTQQIATRFNHSAFGAFAPLLDPQISIYVNVPFGATRAMHQISARIARDMIGVTLGLYHEPEGPMPVNQLRP